MGRMTNITISEEVWNQLNYLKKLGETYDILLRRLLEDLRAFDSLNSYEVLKR